jgi:VanZ family protein
MKTFHRISLILPPIALAVLIYLLSSRTFENAPLGFFLGDKIAHFFVFGILAFLSFRALSNGFKSRASVRTLTIATMLTMFYGATDEFHQSFVFGRQCEAGDLFADALGAISFAMFCFFWQKRREQEK